MHKQISFLNYYNDRPLAERMRPQTLKDFFGQESVIGEGTVLRQDIMNDNMSSMILWGPPGCGKTTLAHIISETTHAELYNLSAVSAGVKEIKDVLTIGVRNHALNLRTILFIDEIHRLNKSQQDVLLSDVENGNVILIGATTENPSFSINRALLSRTRVIVFHSLSSKQILNLLYRALETDEILKKATIQIDYGCLIEIVNSSGGDARVALNSLELVVNYFTKNANHLNPSPKLIRSLLASSVLVYDKKGDEHYQVISALHKSMRNSDPDAAVYWLARMLEAGEDPLFIARRLIRFASEDIGLACNNALQVAVAAYQAAHFVGMPECTLSLTQVVIYFSILPKSNSLYKAYEQAKKVAKETSSLPVPLHLRNASTELMSELHYGEGYQYAHDYEAGITGMLCVPEQLQNMAFYFPSTAGNEKSFKERIEHIKSEKNLLQNNYNIQQSILKEDNLK